jgi:hypothetical protein
MRWLQEEKEYLENLATEPPEETLEMDYYSALVDLREYQYVLPALTLHWHFPHSGLGMN